MVIVKVLLGLCFLMFFALVLSLISRINSLSRQASRLVLAVQGAAEDEKKLAANVAAAENKNPLSK